MGARRPKTAWRAAAWLALFTAGSAWSCGRSIRHDEGARGGSSALGTGGAGVGAGDDVSNAGGAGPSSAGQGPLAGAGTGGVDGTGGDAACVRAAVPIGDDYPALYFMVDRSPPMGDPGAQEKNGFSLLSRALAQFADDYATLGLYAALGYFPSGSDEKSQCSATTYARPSIDEVSLRAAAQDFETSLEAQTIGEDLRPAAALQGSVAWARDFSGQSSREAAVVFVSAGLPTTCPGGAESADALGELVAAAQEGQSPADDSAEPVKSYVIAVADPADHALLQGLDRVSEAGGTTRALVADTRRPLTNEFLKALETIRDAARPCALPLPDNPVAADPAHISVTLADGNGRHGELTLVASDGCTGADDEWHYDALPPSASSLIVLCPSTCARFRARESATLVVVGGCFPPPSPVSAEHDARGGSQQNAWHYAAEVRP